MNPDSENEIQTEELCKPSVKSRLDIFFKWNGTNIQRR